MSTESPNLWTIAKILEASKNYLVNKEIESARLDAELLLAASLQVNRVYLYTHYDKPLNDEERSAMRARLLRRGQHEPVAYILEKREFYGREFFVDKRVLVPRPETELLVDVVLEWCKKNHHEHVTIVDVGTGSGALAVTLACELQDSKVLAIDVSEDALTVARRNAEKHQCADRIQFLLGDLLQPLEANDFSKADIILSNPPYVATDERSQLPRDVEQFEPQAALFAGNLGLDVITRLLGDAPHYLNPLGLFVMEIGSKQKNAVLQMCAKTLEWHDVVVLPDLAQLPRVLKAIRTNTP